MTRIFTQTDTNLKKSKRILTLIRITLDEKGPAEDWVFNKFMNDHRGSS